MVISIISPCIFVRSKTFLSDILERYATIGDSTELPRLICAEGRSQERRYALRLLSNFAATTPQAAAGRAANGSRGHASFFAGAPDFC